MLTKEDIELLKQTFPSREYMNIAINTAIDGLRKQLETKLMISRMSTENEVRDLSNKIANAKVDILSEIKESNNKIANIDKKRDREYSKSNDM